jgi:pyruvate kinase
MASRAQIICSIGPASGDKALLEQMIRAGMDVARINFSHGTHESNGAYIAAIRDAAKTVGRHIPIIQDLSGPREQSGTMHSFDAASPEVTQKDLADLEFGISLNVEYIAQSFVGSAADVRAMRAAIASKGSKIPLIAKIERKEALDTIAEIIEASDAVMVARGDLGVSVPIEDIPFIERDIIAKAKFAGKPVITATQMLLSMKDSPAPTRAEVTDVEFAILLGSDAVMLSEETTIGTYPLEATTAMEKIVSRAERDSTLQVNQL